MNSIKLAVFGLSVVLLALGSAVAGEKTCCEKAIAAKKECANKCCVKAHQAGKSCSRCNPDNQDAKLVKKPGKKS